MSDEGRRNGGDGEDRKQDAGESKAPATVLGAIVSSAVERLQAALQPSEGRTGPNTENVQLWLARVLESMSETRKRREAEQAAAEATTSGGAEAAESDAAQSETSNVVDLATVRDARRSARPSVDVRAVVEHSVAQFVRERVADEGTGEVPPEVTIDGEFVARHGAELLRVVMSSVGQAWLGVLSGALPESVADAVKAGKGASSASAAPAAGDDASASEGEAAAEVASPEVHYDVLNIVAGLLRPPAKRDTAATSSEPSASSDADDDDDA